MKYMNRIDAVYTVYLCSLPLDSAPLLSVTSSEFVTMTLVVSKLFAEVASRVRWCCCIPKPRSTLGAIIVSFPPTNTKLLINLFITALRKVCNWNYLPVNLPHSYALIATDNIIFLIAFFNKIRTVAAIYIWSIRKFKFSITWTGTIGNYLTIYGIELLLYYKII